MLHKIILTILQYYSRESLHILQTDFDKRMKRKDSAHKAELETLKNEHSIQLIKKEETMKSQVRDYARSFDRQSKEVQTRTIENERLKKRLEEELIELRELQTRIDTWVIEAHSAAVDLNKATQHFYRGNELASQIGEHIRGVYERGHLEEFGGERPMLKLETQKRKV